MAVPQAYRETAALESGTQVHHPEHLHAVRGYRVLLPYHANLAKAEGFDQLLDHGDMGNRFVSGCGRRRLHLPFDQSVESRQDERMKRAMKRVENDAPGGGCRCCPRTFYRRAEGLV